MMFEVKEIEAKSILSPTRLKTADFDYSLNPYVGCRFGCVYCYASFMGRFIGKKITDWGNYVFAKINAPELLAEEIKKLKNKGREKTIWLSSVTDPYQGLEVKYKLTRRCLEVLADYGFQGSVGILTKSDLILRDIDVFKRIKKPDLGLTITSTDDKISRYFEKFAPPVSVRLKALERLNKEGFRTYAFIGPLFPHLLADEKQLEKLFRAVAKTGTKEIYVEYFNPSSYILKRLRQELKVADPKLLSEFYQSKKKNLRQEFDKKIVKLIKKYRLKLRFGQTLYHPEMD
ncbi:MAG: radical SAM protein [bacterium]|nr:radical SAM protein [bacterium]